MLGISYNLNTSKFIFHFQVNGEEDGSLFGMDAMMEKKNCKMNFTTISSLFNSIGMKNWT